MFLVNSRLGHFTATFFSFTSESLHLIKAHLLPKLRSYFAECLNMISLKRLGSLYPPTCVGLGYGLHLLCLEAFLGSVESTALRSKASRHQLSALKEGPDLPGTSA